MENRKEGGLTRGNTGNELRTDLQSASDRVRDEASEASRVAREGVQAAKHMASEYAQEAREGLEVQGEKVKGRTAHALESVARAMRSANRELEHEAPDFVSGLVRQAADGLEEASRSLDRRSPGELVDAARDFGRQNPIAFIAGSVLIGFAAARFLGSSAPRSAPASRAEGRSDSHYPPVTAYDRMRGQS